MDHASRQPRTTNAAPFWAGLLIVLAMQGALGFFGYELMHTFEQWGSIVLGIMFVIITVKIAQIGNFHSTATVHGGAEAGTFVLMATIAAAFVVSWGAYASEYSRYMKPDTSRPAIFGPALADRAVVAGRPASFLLLPAADPFDVVRRQVRPSHVIAHGRVVARTPPSVTTLTWPGRAAEAVDFVRRSDAAAASWRTA